MEWLELNIDTSHAGLDAVTDMLEQQGVTGLIIDDEADFQSFLENNRQYWDYVDEELLEQKKGVCRVTFYLERNEAAYGTVAAVRMAMSALKKEHPEYAPLLLTMEDAADEDWENNWKQFYKPMEIGSRLLVVPEWEEAADPERVKLVLNPGLTFGTGSHATTRLCLQALDTHIHGGERVLDLGCGYGWHCKFAEEQGATKILGIDLSKKMIEEAQKRNSGNQIEYRISGLEEYDYPENEWDCVISNLALHYIEDIVEIFQKVYRTLKPGGIFLFNIEHPVFTAGVGQDWIYTDDGKPQYWAIDNYFITGERNTHFLGCDVVKQHHTLTQIIMGLLNNGFELKVVEEAEPPKEMMDIPGMEDELRRPMMLLVKAIAKK